MRNGKDFLETYSSGMHSGIVLDIGSQNVNGSLSEVCPKKLSYVGVDFIEGHGVDVVLKDPYSLPFPDNHADIIVSSSCFEHSEMFWRVFLEILRVLKPSGVFYLNVPSNGSFHRYPVDCWRFYPDSAKALVTWAKFNGIQACLLESFTSAQENDVWNDYVAVFLKDENCIHLYPNRMSSHRLAVENVYNHGVKEIQNYQEHPEDWRSYHSIKMLTRQMAKLFWELLTTLFSKHLCNRHFYGELIRKIPGISGFWISWRNQHSKYR
jgi:SAM-dependent methyltransferase